MRAYKKRIGRSLLLLLFCISTLAVQAFGQLSPGDLSSVHAELEGLTNCTSCHKLGEGPSAEKCLDCHITLRTRIESERGYHYEMVKTEEMSCFECHNEHAGRDFELIFWPDGQQGFDHSVSGFELTGKHATLPCRDCHNPVHIKEEIVGAEPTLDRTRTYFGLKTACLDCHADNHRGQLSSDCLTCHSNEAWKETTGFNHSNTRFNLTGKHTSVACERCHKPIASTKKHTDAPESYRQYRDLSFGNCSACHTDKHQARFGLDCTRCHQTSGWRNVKGAEFDHNKTDFKLIGLHVRVACEKCHTSESKLAGLKHDKCADCHQDIHRGQFVNRADGGRCDACHNEHGYKPALFGLKEHQETDFKLIGAHRAQPCVVCHKTTQDGLGESYRVFTIEDTRCIACHEDIHRGQFAATSPVKQCTDCHKPDYWRVVNFDHDQKTSYPLVGAHRNVTCAGCHAGSKDISVQFVQFRGLDTKCESCHRTGSTVPLEKRGKL